MLASPADKSQTGRKATRTRPDHTRKNQSQQTQRDRRQAGRRRTDKRFVYGSTPDRKIGGWCGLPDSPRYNRRLLYDTTRDRSVASLTVYLGFELSEYRLEYGVSSIGSNATAGAGLLGYWTTGLLYYWTTGWVLTLGATTVPLSDRNRKPHRKTAENVAYGSVLCMLAGWLAGWLAIRINWPHVGHVSSYSSLTTPVKQTNSLNVGSLKSGILSFSC